MITLKDSDILNHLKIIQLCSLGIKWKKSIILLFGGGKKLGKQNLKQKYFISPYLITTFNYR